MKQTIDNKITKAHAELEKLSKLHMAAWLNAAMDPSRSNILQAQALDKKFDVLLEKYTDLVIRAEVILERSPSFYQN